jgi:hypothetical protein
VWEESDVQWDGVRTSRRCVEDMLFLEALRVQFTERHTLVPQIQLCIFSIS